MQNSLPVVIILIFGFLIIFYLLNKRLKELTEKKSDQALLEWLRSMQSSIDNTNKTLNEALRDTNKHITNVLQDSSKTLNERLDKAAEVISNVQKNIGEMSAIGRSMQELQDFLKNPKLRGNIGEQVLKELLSQMLPKQSFNLQYSFKNGSVVDAAIKTEAGIIPIDSKFPMENFRKMTSLTDEKEKKTAEKDFSSDVKKHIDTISSKYILTDEGTIDYALMYIPTESVYYEIVNSPSLFDYAHDKKVLPVSPTTFYAYLKAILMGFEGQKISQKAQEILSGLKSVQKEYEKMEENIGILSKHIHNSYQMINQVHVSSAKLGQKIINVSSIKAEELKDSKKQTMIEK